MLFGLWYLYMMYRLLAAHCIWQTESVYISLKFIFTSEPPASWCLSLLRLFFMALVYRHAERHSSLSIMKYTPSRVAEQLVSIFVLGARVQCLHFVACGPLPGVRLLWVRLTYTRG